MPGPLRALVVEDEWPARNYLVELIESSGLARVIGAVGSVAEALQVLDEDGPAVDVAFVDVQLASAGRGESGLSLVRALEGRPGGPLFVLATAHQEHALEAFDLGVADYLLKPFSEERVGQCLERLRQRRGASETPQATRIVARRKRSLVFLEPREIWAFEAADRLTFVHTLHGSFDIDLSLAAVESSFGAAFLRTHRNWLVNAAHIRELERDGNETRLFVGVGLGEGDRGLTVPVARERAAAVRELLLANTTGLKK